MAWSLEFEPAAQRAFGKLDKAVSDHILRTLKRDLDRLGDPRAFGEAMVGNWSGFWRYRVGDWRAICRIEDVRVVVVVITVAHRREVYR